jgi:AcrR family transcriptional regulator
MPEEERRSYRSSVRQQQADETRARIIASAAKLLESSGYAGMTIEGVAQDASVSPQTVYAVFGSKTGILTELLRRSVFGERYLELVKQAKASEDPVERMRYVASIARTIYDAEDVTMRLLEGAGAVAPKLGQVIGDLERQRYDSQVVMVEFIRDAGALRADVTFDEARDVMWVLTNRTNYRMFTSNRGWTSDRYERWLGDTLIRSLLSDR